MDIIYYINKQVNRKEGIAEALPLAIYRLMELLKRTLLTIICFFAAIACYIFGIPAGGIVFLILGLVFEGLFWLGIFGKKKK